MTWGKQFLAWASNYEIARTRALYEADNSPIHVWRAYRWARQASAPIPDWVLALFDDVADRLDKQEPTSPKEVAEAFGMTGRKKRNARTHSDQLTAAQHVCALQEKSPEMSDKDIFAEIARQWAEATPRSRRRHVTAAYVEKAYYKFRAKL